MFRVLILGVTVSVVLIGIIVVSPILDGSIEGESFVAAIQAITPQQSPQIKPRPAIVPSCIISAHPSVISRGEEASIAWRAESAVSASLSGVGDVPLRGGFFVGPLMTGDYVLSVLSSTGEWSFCTTAITVR